jgi:hypothetical protein
VKKRDRVAREVVFLGHHQVGADGSIKTAQFQYVVSSRAPTASMLESSDQEVELTPGRLTLSQPLGNPHRSDAPDS